MNNKGRIGIIGHFGGGHNFLDGQTVKTKILYEELLKAGYKDIFCVDTYYNQVNKAKLLVDSFRCILKCKTIIILLSGNGMKIYFPMMYLAKRMFGRRIFHDVIGGNLASYVKKYPKYVNYLNSFDGNWIEFQKMKDQLEYLGIHNCIVIPNFKRLDMNVAKLVIDQENTNAFCMLSRVTEEKGITEAIEAVNKYNREHEQQVYLNIWGPVDEKYKEKFEEKIKTSTDKVQYKGRVDYSESAATLTNHLALLFPTHWDGEGFPGTIVDAYTAALPVIASDWNANSELIENFQTGWVYPNEKQDSLYQSIEWAMEHRQEMLVMREKCHKKALEYTPEASMRIIIHELEKNK